MAEDEGVNAHGSQGVQVGTRNVQHNNYYRPADASFLTALNPHKALARLRQLSHEDAVSELASAPPDDVAEVLKVMLGADEALAVALLADINPRKARELIGPLVQATAWLSDLAAAAGKIARRAAELTWDRDGSTGVLERLTAASGSGSMYARRYSNGVIWDTGERHGAHEMSNAIAEVYLSPGPIVLGFPRGPEIPLQSGHSGAAGNGLSCNYAMILTSAHGTYVVPGPVLGTYSSMRGAASWLGFPVGERELRSGRSRQRFEGGAIVSSGKGTFTVRQAILGVYGNWEVPVADEAEATSPFNTTGWTQKSLDLCNEMLTCSSQAHGTHRVTSATLRRYQALGGAESWLGFPVSEAERLGHGSAQRFEGGTICQYNVAWWTDEAVAPDTAIAVPAETVTLICDAHGGDLGGCGMPVSEEQPIGTGTSDRIQFFESAVITLRNGRRELWPRPQGT
jgi:hypothetical protein